MWLILSFCSAFFAGLTAILAKIGISGVDSNVSTAIRTIVITIFSWLIVFLTGSFSTIKDIDAHSLLFLFLSGLATGGSWLCYFRALQLGDVNRVTPIDKSSTVLTIILSAIILNESITGVTLFAIVAIGTGTMLMIVKKPSQQETVSYMWLIYACLSALLAALTSILGKIGVSDINSNVGTAIRTVVVLVAAWSIVFLQKKPQIRNIGHRNLLFIVLSGITTGLSWLCYYRALQDGPASVVVPIDKLSIVVTVVFSYIVSKEKLSFKAVIGLFLIVFGTLAIAVF